MAPRSYQVLTPVQADRFDGRDLHVATTGDDLLLAGAMALNLCRRALDAQIFGRQRAGMAVREVDFEPTLFLEDAQLDRPGRSRRFVAAAVGHGLGEVVGCHGLALTARRGSGALRSPA